MGFIPKIHSSFNWKKTNTTHLLKPIEVYSTNRELWGTLDGLQLINRYANSHTMDCYLGKKRNNMNEPQMQFAKWKTSYCILSHLYNIREKKNLGTEYRSVVAGKTGHGRCGRLQKDGRGNLWVLELFSVLTVVVEDIQICNFVRIHKIIHRKVNVIERKFLKNT